MDPNEFPGSLGPLSLPDKPLIGDLPADMEFGEDLLASQTASVPQASALQPQEMEWEVPKEAASDSDSGLGLVKAGGLSDLSKPKSLGLDKSDPLAILEKPGILGSLSKEDELEASNKSEDLGSLYKAGGSVDPEDGTGDPSAPGTEALVPEAWKEESVCKTEPEDPKVEGMESAASLPANHAMESPDVVEVSNTPPSQELTASPVGSPGSQRLAKKARLKAPRKSSPLWKEEASAEEETESVLNSMPGPASELVGESPAEAEKESSACQKDPAKVKVEEAAQSPSLPGGYEQQRLSVECGPSPPFCRGEVPMAAPLASLLEKTLCSFLAHSPALPLIAKQCVKDPAALPSLTSTFLPLLFLQPTWLS